MNITARALFLVFFFTLVTLSDESSALLRGVVLDQAGAAVSGATVSLISLDRIREAKTNEAGKFEFADSPFGTYDLRISREGFKPHTIENLHVSSSKIEPLSMTLQVLVPSACWIIPIPSYEKRTDETNLAGSLSDSENGYVEHASVKVTLLKTGRTRVGITGKRGGFQFKGLEPGKYTLTVNHRKYWYPGQPIEFRIARENLTRFSAITVLNKNTRRIFICQ